MQVTREQRVHVFLDPGPDPNPTKTEFMDPDPVGFRSDLFFTNIWHSLRFPLRWSKVKMSKTQMSKMKTIEMSKGRDLENERSWK